jgi:hypothetical protein
LLGAAGVVPGATDGVVAFGVTVGGGVVVVGDVAPGVAVGGVTVGGGVVVVVVGCVVPGVTVGGGVVVVVGVVVPGVTVGGVTGGGFSVGLLLFGSESGVVPSPIVNCEYPFSYACGGTTFFSTRSFMLLYGRAAMMASA